jgi:hypothetical protein
MFFAVWGTAIVQSRRRGGPTPTLLMIAVTTSLTWLDPIMNWAPYAAYDPRMFHFDVDWFWFDLAPTVEPWAVTIGYGYFFLIPAWLTLAVYRRLAARTAVTSWLVRRPKLAVLALSVLICVVWDGVMEALFVRMGFYTYTQTIGFGSIFAGTPHQFPLIWEAVLFGIVLSVAAPLMWVDDSGRTWPEVVARRTKIFAKRDRLDGDERRLCRLRPLLRHHPGHRHRHRARPTLALPRDKGLRPAGLLRKGG